MKKEKCYKKELSSREVVTRDLRIFVSDGMVNEREKIRRSRITNFRDDRPLFNNNKAFTLIELLVVVLIIGILAAVAVPQYQKAVERSRSREAISLLQSVYQAAKTYELSSGEWPDSFDELAVEIPWTGTEKWSTAGYIKDTRSNGTWSLQIYKDPSVALYKSIYLGRISGKYEGTGFNMNLNRAWACVERTSTGKVFTGNAGDYCVKILHCSGSPSTTGDGRYYSAQSCSF